MARDLQGGTAEVLTPPLMADYIASVFNGSDHVSVNVETDQSVIKKEYPGVEAVNRGCNGKTKRVLVQNRKGERDSSCAKYESQM